MSMTITDTLMTSDRAEHVARFSPDAAANGQGAWVVSWLPTRLLDRNQAITAMTFAELVDDPVMRPHLENWAAELGVDVDEAIRKVRA